MYFIGDVHGKIEPYLELVKSLPKGASSLQIGDMGVGFKGVNLPHYEPPVTDEELVAWAEKCDGLGSPFSHPAHLFFRGNHDSPQACQKHSNYLSDYGYDEEEKLFWLGGAWSIDWQWRIEGVSWWPDEELSAVELNYALELYKATKPLLVATHEAPSKAAVFMLSPLLLAPKPTDGPVVVEHDESYHYYKAKLGCVNTRTSQVLQQMVDVHKPQHWVFGHYHVRADFEIDGVQYHCLPELAVAEFVPELNPKGKENQ